jgi:hypothetical protein
MSMTGRVFGPGSSSRIYACIVKRLMYSMCAFAFFLACRLQFGPQCRLQRAIARRQMNPS